MFIKQSLVENYDFKFMYLLRLLYYIIHINYIHSFVNRTLFTMNFMDVKPERGFYKISISAGSTTNLITVKVLSEVVVDYLEIGTADADQTMQPKLVR